MNLVDWLKMMVGSRRSEEVVDPNMETRPSIKALKRTLLTALRCVDPESEKRPKMGQVVSMLESDEHAPHQVCNSILTKKMLPHDHQIMLVPLESFLHSSSGSKASQEEGC